jgi:hypothetical protein
MLRKMNGTYHAEAMESWDSSCNLGQQKTCPVCCLGLGHDDELELIRVTVDGQNINMWVCNCRRNLDCGFAYPASLSETEVEQLIEERNAYLRSRGIGIGAERV